MPLVIGLSVVVAWAFAEEHQTAERVFALAGAILGGEPTFAEAMVNGQLAPSPGLR
jgi:hypothetical protein